MLAKQMAAEHRWSARLQQREERGCRRRCASAAVRGRIFWARAEAGCRETRPAARRRRARRAGACCITGVLSDCTCTADSSSNQIRGSERSLQNWEGSTTVIRLQDCRLAKSHGLMRRVTYGAVIGQKIRFFVCAQYELPGYAFLFSQSQRRISPFSSNHGISPNDTAVASVNYSLQV